MIFASTDLVLRIEHTECSMLRESVEALLRRRPESAAFARALSSGVATFAGPGSPMNKVAGLGFAGAIDEGELEAIENEYARRDTDVQVELATLADPSVGALLTRRGYALIGFENVLGRALPFAPSAPPPRDVAIARCAPHETGDWLEVVVAGFASPDVQGVASHESFARDAIERAIEDVTAARGFVRYIARRSGQPAGGASMRLCDGIAQLCGAATLPAHRRRGIQSALLQTRLTDATRAGAELAVVTTLPGSKSMQNVQREGFELLYSRAILVRAR